MKSLCIYWFYTWCYFSWTILAIPMRCKPSLDGIWFSLYLEFFGQTDFPTWCVPSTDEVWIMWLCFESLKCSISGPGNMVLWYIKWFFFGSLVWYRFIWSYIEGIMVDYWGEVLSLPELLAMVFSS